MDQNVSQKESNVKDTNLKEYCAFVPYQLVVNDNLTKGYIRNSIVANDTSLLSSVNKLCYDSGEIILFTYDKEINIILMDKNSCKFRRIPPTINDFKHNICFAALSIKWIELNDNTLYDDASINYLHTIYQKNHNIIIKQMRKTMHNFINKNYPGYTYKVTKKYNDFSHHKKVIND